MTLDKHGILAKLDVETYSNWLVFKGTSIKQLRKEQGYNYKHPDTRIIKSGSRPKYIEIGIFYLIFKNGKFIEALYYV